MTVGRGIEEAGSTGDRCAEVLLTLASPVARDPLTYRVPAALEAKACVGMRVLVPFGPLTRHGVIVDVHRCNGAAARPLRDLLDIPDSRPVFSAALLALARRVAEDSAASLGDAVRCLVPPEVARRPPASSPRVQVALLDHGRIPSRCGLRQRAIVDALAASGSLPPADLIRLGGQAALRRLIAAGAVHVADAPSSTSPAGAGPGAIESAAGEPGAIEPATLLWGDAAARRRWIVDAVAETLRAGGRAILTVPETALVPGLAAVLHGRWGDRVAEFHSDMSTSRRRLSWTRIQAGEIDVVVGTRSALFAPLGRLGLIVVDEEQDPSYKAEEAPRYHGRTVALARGDLERTRVVLGASAPSLESFAAAVDGRMRAVRLRPSVQHVPVTVVDMRSERREGRMGILARPLLEAIRRHLRGGGRVALFVNRVGYARVLACRECGRAVRCARCEIPMPYDGETKAVQCRICGTASPAPDVCPRCKGVALRWVGAGTARVLEVIRRLFPALRAARLDRETARGFETVAKEFAAGRIRLVVGTQLLLRARQLCPSLVGVVDADSPLYRPDFRAAERTFQDLRAVIELAAGPLAEERLPAGQGERAAGAGAPGPEAVLQTRLPEHPVITALRTGCEDPLYREELRVREQFGYPPYAHLARLVAGARDRATAEALAARAAAVARSAGVDVLGPAPIVRARGPAMIRVQCLLRAHDPDRVRAAARAALAETVPSRGCRLVADMDPQELY